MSILNCNAGLEDESREFVKRAFPATSVEDRESLAARLSDHPLAITQAVNYCRVTGRTADDFLLRLAQEPVRVLNLGQASGHLDSVVKTITMSMEAAEERCAGSSYLLTLLSHLGNDPVDEGLLEAGVGIAFVSVAVTASHKRRLRQKRRLIFRQSPRQPPTVTYSATVLAQHLFRLFKDSAWRDSAVETLLMTSLVSRRGHGLIVHPLIARIVREFAEDSRPWLEIGFGLFIELTQSGSERDFTNLDPHLDHISALASIALEKGFGGPAIIVACYVLARRIGMTAGSLSEDDRGSIAVEFGRAAVRLAEEQAVQEASTVDTLAAAQRALAQALATAGRPNDAMAQLRNTLELSRRYNHEGLLVGTLVDIATLASDVPDREIADTVLHELNNYCQEHDLDIQGQMFMAYAKSRLLRRLGRTNEAAETLRTAMNASGQTTMPRESMRADFHDIASMLARDQDEGASVLEHAMTALAIRRRNMGEKPDSQFMEALVSAADAAIDALQLNEAQDLIKEAEDLTRANFGTKSYLYGRVLCIRGRLKMMVSELEDALRDLESGLSIMRWRSEEDPARLPAPRFHIAQAAFLMGDREKARRYVREAYDIDCSIYGPDHPRGYQR